MSSASSRAAVPFKSAGCRAYRAVSHTLKTLAVRSVRSGLAASRVISARSSSASSPSVGVARARQSSQRVSARALLAREQFVSNLTIWLEPDGSDIKCLGFGRILGRRREPAMNPKTITLPGDLYERVQQEAQGEGKTVDEVATEALKRELARRWLERTRREAEIRRGGMT